MKSSPGESEEAEDPQHWPLVGGYPLYPPLLAGSGTRPALRGRSVPSRLPASPVP